MSKHTPGPWSHQYSNSDSSGGGQWYEVSAPTWFPYNASAQDEETAEANARLMASAPDLLEALEAFVDGVVPEDPNNTLWVEARAAIAKAKGQP